MRSKRKGRWCLPKLNPLVPSKFTYVQDVSFLSKSGKIWRVFSQLKNIFGGHVGYGGSLFRTIFSEDHMRVFIAHVFAYRLLKHINTQSCPIDHCFPPSKIRSVMPILWQNCFSSFDLWYLCESAMIATGTPTYFSNNLIALGNTLTLLIAST